MSPEPVGDRAHLSIGEVLSLLQDEFPDVTISKIRFLESQGLLDPERTPSGYRKFYEFDIERLRWILREQREHFLPLKVIKDRLEEYGDVLPPHSDASTAAAIVAASASTSASPAASGGVASPPAAGAGSAAPEPIWMADVARHQASRQAGADSAGAPAPAAAGAEPAGAASADGEAGSPGADAQPAAAESGGRTVVVNVTADAAVLDQGISSVSLTADELCSASGLTTDQLRELQQFGLLAADRVGADEFFDGNSLVIAQKAAALSTLGLDPRHLRAFKVAADREAGLFEQLVMPLLKQRNPASRQQAVERLAELTALGQSLRGALMRQALRDHL